MLVKQQVGYKEKKLAKLAEISTLEASKQWATRSPFTGLFLATLSTTSSLAFTHLSPHLMLTLPPTSHRYFLLFIIPPPLLSVPSVATLPSSSTLPTCMWFHLSSPHPLLFYTPSLFSLFFCPHVCPFTRSLSRHLMGCCCYSNAEWTCLHSTVGKMIACNVYLTSFFLALSSVKFKNMVYCNSRKSQEWKKDNYNQKIHEAYTNFTTNTINNTHGIKWN